MNAVFGAEVAVVLVIFMIAALIVRIPELFQ